MLALPPDAAATVADAATVLASAPAHSSCAAASRGLTLDNRSVAATPAVASVAVSDVGRPGVVDGEGYIASPALGPPPGAAATADTPAVLAPAPVRFTRASAKRERELVSRRSTAKQPLAPAIASDVTTPIALDGEGYIPPSALGLPLDAAPTVADAAAALATAPARVPRAAADRQHDASALTSYHSGNVTSTQTPVSSFPRRRGNLTVLLSRKPRESTVKAVDPPAPAGPLRGGRPCKHGFQPTTREGTSASNCTYHLQRRRMRRQPTTRESSR